MSKDTQLQKLGRLTVGEFFGPLSRMMTPASATSWRSATAFGISAKRAASRAPSTSSAGRRAFSCSSCGDHVYPGAGTIFQDSRTPLRVWFYAIYLFVTTRHGVSGKELQRTLGVTYKCAYRMGQQIRVLMAKADGFEEMKGHVEIDEAYVGGYRPGRRTRTRHQ